MTTPTYQIHPAIGIARVGNSPDSFYISPEATGAPPIDCAPDGTPITKDGVEQPVTQYKDAHGRIRRQAARFRIYVYDDANPEGHEIKIGDTIEGVRRRSGQLLTGTLVDIRWTAYLANKKSSWYEFHQLNGEHGYLPGHTLRNSAITDAGERQWLIIDPGPRTVSWTNPKLRVAQFAKSAPTGTPGSFPPELQPNSITTLGELRSTTGADGHNRLLILGGFGNSGSTKTGMGQPSIQHYANNDGWFDDISDGPVSANLVVNVTKIDDSPAPPGVTQVIPVDVPGWVITGYPRYAPQIVDIVTMDDLVYDVAVRNFNYAPAIFKHGEWNNDYYPYFWRDIWPILVRPFSYQFVADIDPLVGGDPHDTSKGAGGNMDPDQLSAPPFVGTPTEQANHAARRAFIWKVLRKAGQENQLYAAHPKQGRILFAMPLLCGDNPLSNEIVSKFLRLTDTQLFLLHQWAEGKFVNEILENITAPALPEAVMLDRGVLGNALGGSFCPGGEAAWVMRNPAIYSGSYRIKQAASWTPGSLSQPSAVSGADITASLANGSEPGDLTKYSAVPWQADFNECTKQDNNITYENWNEIDSNSSGDSFHDQTFTVYWWPAHRPVNVLGAGAWSPTPNTNAGDLEMVTVWSLLGFVVPAADWTPDAPDFHLVENAILG